ncbi:hypothetical protein M9H77_03281 [Catharanthus roseus]|uniref:Uncharacterized protein n=1 Tax=Catharanthus roseus TaxID=4058 RepID=A0ACC0CB83_CATRO|nr:hypothetical protein M9H77_03281 [Catharanthus roseus]
MQGEQEQPKEKIKAHGILSHFWNKDECSKEKENDLEKNKRTKEMSEEKQENSKEEFDESFSFLCHVYYCLSSHFSLEDPLMTCSVMFDPSSYGFGNLDGTSIVEFNIVGFALEFDKKFLQHVCTITSMRGRRHTMEFEGQGQNVGGKLILCYGYLTIRMDLRMNHFKEGTDGMTRDAQETVELL